MGIVSSQPYAIKALQASTGHHASLSLLQQHASHLIPQSTIPYLQDKQITVNQQGAVIQTEFYVDHTEVGSIIKLHAISLRSCTSFYLFLLCFHNLCLCQVNVLVEQLMEQNKWKLGRCQMELNS